MYHEVINLRDESLCNGFMPTLTVYRLSVVKCDCPRPAVIVCPGGKHGLSLYSDETFRSVNLFRRKYDWLSQSVEWLINLFDLRLRPIIEY